MKGLFGLMHESSLRHPDRTFVQDLDQVWTYSEAVSMAQGISEYLLQYGIQKGDRVLILCDNSMQYIAAFFGILGINAIAVPVNPSKMTDSITYIIEKCTPRLILACSAAIHRLDTIRGKLKLEVINIDSLFWDENYKAEPTCDIDTDDVAMILFTSGTTAYPKGVTLTHGNLLANTEAIVEYLHLTSEDSIFMTLPFTYSYGNSILLTHASVGAAIVIENTTAYPYKVLEGIKKYQVSGFSTVGSYINLMLKVIKNSEMSFEKISELKEDFFRSLRYITFAGEAVGNDDVLFINRRFPHIKAYVMYGQTEAGARLSYLDPELLPGKIGSIGKGLCNVELKVVDEAGTSIKPGELGEIIAGGPNIMKGYWKDPQATEEVLRDGWLYTGDNAIIDEAGYIYIKGRKTDMIKHMGHRISPVEIENVINGCKGIRESAVVEVEAEGLPVIKAFIVPEKEHAIEYSNEWLTEEIRRCVCSRLPVYMRPQIFEVLEQLPKTDSGKIKRSALRLRSSKCAE